jgi:DNA-binding XRE family transcriptional regulator
MLSISTLRMKYAIIYPESVSNLEYFMQSSSLLLRQMGERIRDARIAAQLTQGMLAKRAGVSRDTVTRVERGENIGVEALVRIAIALDAIAEFSALFPERDTRSLDEILAAQRRPQRVRPRKPKTTVAP